jgi:GNAT superfamily N-acetyltransferase/catechol 2,3-dioxygenase-like lactoylglutathione lyase family enzyme
MLTIRSLDETDRPWANQFLLERWGSVKVVSRGQIHDPSILPGFVAVLEERPVGLLTYHIMGGSCEIVTIDSDLDRGGVGSALIEAARKKAAALGCWRLWLITTNDNLHALRFYQKRGFTLATIHVDAIRESRRLKPQIPLTGLHGIPIRDEIELEFRLGASPTGIQGLNHVQITIPKGAEAEARRFYGEILGLAEIEKPDSLKGRGGFWMQLGRQQLHIGTEDSVNRQATKAHLAYEVTNLEVWRTRLAQAGVTIEESMHPPSKRGRGCVPETHDCRAGAGRIRTPKPPGPWRRPKQRR